MDTKLVTIWSKSANGSWLIERTYGLSYALSLGLSDTPGQPVKGEDGRLYAWFEPGEGPND